MRGSSPRLLENKGQIHKKEISEMQKTERKPLFDLGQLVATPGALAALEKSGQSPMDFLSRHVAGDLREIPEEDKQVNPLSLEKSFPLMNSYRTNTNAVVMVITASPRSHTTQ